MTSAAAALLLVALPPLECPAGAEVRGGGPPGALEEWCEGKDPAGQPRRHGPARAWYDDGVLRVEEHYREGQRDGPFTEYHRNGLPARTGTFDLGRRTGLWRIFYESGAPEEAAEWRNGVPHGQFVTWWPGGGKRSEGRHCGGAQCGVWRTWDEAGRPLGTVEYAEQSLDP